MSKVDLDHVVNEAIRSSIPLLSSAFASSQSSAIEKKDKGPNRKKEEKHIVLNIPIWVVRPQDNHRFWLKRPFNDWPLR